MSDITLNAFLSKMRVKNLTKKGGRICMKIRNGPLKIMENIEEKIVI